MTAAPDHRGRFCVALSPSSEKQMLRLRQTRRASPPRINSAQLRRAGEPLGAAVVGGSFQALSEETPTMAFQLPDLPFAKDALAPHMSAETLEFHHGKHHKAYVTKTNELLEQQSGLSGASLIEVVRQAKSSGNAKLFNNSAQLWNHSF